MLGAAALVASALPLALGSPLIHRTVPNAPPNCTQECNLWQNVSMSYQETDICETTPGVQGFSGYVHLPAALIADSQDPAYPYDANIFFWYFQSRHNPESAPLTVWFAGGPGEAGGGLMTADNGPCYVNNDQNSTTLNQWSSNDYSNVLYIDQPVQSGFSYNKIVNATYNGVTATITPVDQYDGQAPEANSTLWYGEWADQNPNTTTTTTTQASMQMWQFMQVFMNYFPEYNTSDSRVNYWGNSYGGYWVSGLGAYTQQQNEAINNNTACGTVIPLDTVGFTNACMDIEYQSRGYATIPYNNTYGVQFYNETVYESALNNLTKTGGCLDQLYQCREIADTYDPLETGLNASVNAICATAGLYCFAYTGQAAYILLSNRSAFDMSQIDIGPNSSSEEPNFADTGYFNQEWVRAALGVPVGWNSDSVLVANNFLSVSGDFIRYEGLKRVNYLLSQGVKATFVYGDRDTRCNWLDGLNLTQNIAWPGASQYTAAGFADMQTNSSYQGGFTKQYGNLSFTRVFQAGHDVGFFQPETVYEVFNRATVFNTDVATGKVSNDPGSNSPYLSQGPGSSFDLVNETITTTGNVLCDIWGLDFSCTNNQIAAVMAGNATIVNGIITEPAADFGSGIANGGGASID